MYGMIVMLRYHQTNSGALNTMVALKWNGKGEIDILVTILVCWRLGPYADPDQQGDIVGKCVFFWREKRGGKMEKRS